MALLSFYDSKEELNSFFIVTTFITLLVTGSDAPNEYFRTASAYFNIFLALNIKNYDWEFPKHHYIVLEVLLF